MQTMAETMRIFKEESGQSVVLVALFMGMFLFGFLAFAIDGGYLFHERRMAQAAADAAAIAAAEEVSYGNSGNAQAAANAAATLNGLNTSAATNPATVTLTTLGSGNYSYTGSSSAAPTSWVQATVSQPVPTFFLGTFNSSMKSLSVSASAVASGGQSSPTCVCLEGSTGQDLNMSNNSKITANSCGVTVDSSSGNAVGIVGSASLSALTLGTVSSTWDNSSNINNNGSISSSTKVVQGISTSCAPAMPPAPTYSTCVADPGGSYGTFTFGPSSSGGTICYQNLTVGANGSTDTLNPGIYVVTGSLHFESGANGHSNLGGNGVFFYLPGTASLTVDNGAVINLVSGGSTESGGATAPSLGAYNGILVYQATGNTSTLNVQGGSSAYLNGALYAPSAPINLANGTSTSFTADIVAQTLTMAGGGTLTSQPTSNLGTLNISVAKLSQ